MTGGRVRRVRRYVGAGTFMVTYGDGVSDVDIRKLLRFHQEHGKLATVSAVQPTSRFGILDIDGERVKSFSEKPKLEGWSSAGFFVFEQGIFDYLEGDDCILEREPLERLARDGQLMVHRHTGFFYAMDTYREYEVLNAMWDQGKAPWKVWSR
jgi:glucose-1-phosphate cytidylyltransferase